MGVLEDLADGLAKDALEFADKSSDPHIVDEISEISEISEIVGATSSTLQEAYLTSVRMRLAEARGRKHLSEKVSGVKSSDDK